MSNPARPRLTRQIRQRQREGRMPVLSEIKVRSPKEGDLLRGRPPEWLAQRMTECAIAGLSVVTEPEQFGGSLELINRLRPLVPHPILRKDFVRSSCQVWETAEAGASAILLIVALLPDVPLRELHAEAQAQGLETLVEVHNLEELRRVLGLGIRPDIVGINNRDILVGETDEGDVSVTEALAPYVPDGALILSESSLRGPEDVARAREAGADAVLVGTAALVAADLEGFLESLIAVGWR